MPVAASEHQLRQETHALVGAMAPQPTSELTDRTRLVGDLGYDSVRLIELMMALEQMFDLPRVEQDIVDPAGTVGDVVRLVLEINGRPA